MDPTVEDVMTTPVVAVHAHTSFQTMAATLRAHRFSAFPVLDEAGRVIGVVSEADLLAKQALDSEPSGMPGMITGRLRQREHEKARGTCAQDLMTHPAITVRPGDSVGHAARLMYTLQVKRMPVVDADGLLVGIVSRADLLAPFDRTDEDIHAEILGDVLRCDFGADPAAFTVSVAEGVVTIGGTPQTADQGHHLVSQIRHVTGVVAVRDELSYPAPGRP